MTLKVALRFINYFCTYYFTIVSSSVIQPYMNNVLPSRGRGVLPYKSDGGARRKISTTPSKGRRILFYGRDPNSFPPLRGTYSTTTNCITGTANFNSNKDNYIAVS